MTPALFCPYCRRRIYREMSMRERLAQDPELRVGMGVMWRQLGFIVGMFWVVGVVCSSLVTYLP